MATLLCPPAYPTQQPMTTSFAPPAIVKGQFAFARINGDVHLVQSPPTSPVVPADVHVFRHEFINIFRYSHTRAFHPADIHILEPIDERLTRYEEESEVVFLARDLMERLRRMTERRAAAGGGGFRRR